VSCLTVEVGNDAPLYVHATHVYQSPGGHHVLAMAIDETAAGGDTPHACGAEDWRTRGLRFVGIGATNGSGVTMPDGVAMLVPAHAKLLLQSHYINDSAETMRAQDLVRFDVVDAGSVAQVAGFYMADSTHLVVPAHATATQTFGCHPPFAMTVPWMFPHMHDWGTHASLVVEHADGTTTPIYDGDWSPDLRDRFPFVEFASPMTLGPSDTVRTTCTWENTGDVPLDFPREMCAAFMPYYPSDGSLWTCDDDGVNVHVGT